MCSWAAGPVHPWIVTRLGTAVALAYALAVITVFLSVVAIWPSTSSVPSVSVVRPSTSLPVTIVTASPHASTPSPSVAPTVAIPTERPTRPPIPVPTPVPTKAPIPTKAPTEPPPPTEPPILAIHGEATFYCLPPLSPCTAGFLETGLYAAAGAELRAALGDWRGRQVTVWYGSRHVTVTLIDSMSNPDGLVDLYASVFVLLAPLELGVIDVEVTWN